MSFHDLLSWTTEKATELTPFSSLNMLCDSGLEKSSPRLMRSSTLSDVNTERVPSSILPLECWSASRRRSDLKWFHETVIEIDPCHPGCIFGDCCEDVQEHESVLGHFHQVRDPPEALHIRSMLHPLDPFRYISSVLDTWLEKPSSVRYRLIVTELRNSI